MFEMFLAAIQQMLGVLQGRLTATRAGLIDNLDAAISTRAAASTALSTAQWTNALAAALLAVKQRPPTSYTGGGNEFATYLYYNVFSIGGTSRALSGAMTANTLKTLLSVTGAGTLNFAGIFANDATSRTMRVKVTIDGVVVVDPGMSPSINVAGLGIVPVGALAGYYDGTYYRASAIPAKLSFNSSLLVQYASSLSETDKIQTFISCEVH